MTPPGAGGLLAAMWFAKRLECVYNEARNGETKLNF